MKGYRRSVDDVGYKLSDKNVILLKIDGNEGVPRMKIKLRATNGYLKQRKSSKIELNNKAENETFNFYIQINNETVLSDFPVKLSRSSNDIDYDYQASETTVLALNENDYLYDEVTRNTSGSPLDELHYSLPTSDSDASTISYDDTTYTTPQKSYIDSIALVNNLTMISSEATDAIETETTQTVHIHDDNLTQNGSSNVTTTFPEVSNADQLLDNVDKYRKIFSHSLYQRDKSEPDVVEDMSQVTSDFLLHFLPLVVPHALPRSVNLMSLSNNENYESNFMKHKLLKSSPIVDKIITVSSINKKTSLPYSDYELNNKINHPKIRNTTLERDNTTSAFENKMRDSTATTDVFTITFLRKYLTETLKSFSTPNMTIVYVTPLEKNLHESKNSSFNNSVEIKYNATLTTSTPRVNKEVNFI